MPCDAWAGLLSGRLPCFQPLVRVRLLLFCLLIFFILSIFVCLLLVCLLFLFNTTSRFRHTGLGSDPGAYPDYILALHSSKRLLAEQLSSSYHLLVQFISITIIILFIINKFPFLFAFQTLDTLYVRQNKTQRQKTQWQIKMQQTNLRRTRSYLWLWHGVNVTKDGREWLPTTSPRCFKRPSCS